MDTSRFHRDQRGMDSVWMAGKNTGCAARTGGTSREFGDRCAGRAGDSWCRWRPDQAAAYSAFFQALPAPPAARDETLEITRHAVPLLEATTQYGDTHTEASRIEPRSLASGPGDRVVHKKSFDVRERGVVGFDRRGACHFSSREERLRPPSGFNREVTQMASIRMVESLRCSSRACRPTVLTLPTPPCGCVSAGAAIVLSAAMLLVPAAVAAGPAAARPASGVPTDAGWHDVTSWGVEGRGWSEQERQRWFDRFPAKAQGKVTDAVWNLSRDSAGMMARFKTDAREIYARYTLSKKQLAMPHMPATGVSGLDLYARDERGTWRWVMVTKPTTVTMEAVVIGGLAAGMREYALYLPLYNGVESLAIGVPAGAAFEGLPPRADKPIVFYGTSITHGACASRPGMVHTAILGRRFDRPVLNLGFSGNGKMDTAVGSLLTEVDAAVYVVDCLPNMGAAEVTAKCGPLVKQLREARPNAPIVLVEDRRNTNSWILPDRDKHHTANHAALRSAYEQLVKDGVSGLFYIEGDHLYGDDTEGATDASHASDLGFMRQADIFEPILRQALTP
jgi:hypothetical protein